MLDYFVYLCDCRLLLKANSILNLNNDGSASNDQVSLQHGSDAGEIFQSCNSVLLIGTILASTQSFILPHPLYVIVCRTRSLVYVYSCFKARRGALPRVSRPLYLQSPPNVRLRLFAPALVPSGRGLSSVVLVPSCFVASH